MRPTAVVLALLALGCESGALDEISVEECEESGGEVVGDTGAGETLDPEFLCPSGDRPFARVTFGIEGGVCCPP